jgi:predicted DNA-binding transcriptional regulator YafY|tara:strand:- start:10705 stop:11721 length:1017 start_codon:yes stop_codon:yes gene_type:complete
MPANKYALLRYRVIDKCIRNKYKPYPSKEDIRQACEDFLYNSFKERVSISTVEKDLYAMRNEEGLGYMAPIKFSRDLGGYFYSEPSYSIDKLPLNEDDIEAVKFAAHTLSQFKKINVFDQFSSAIEKLMDRIELTDNIQDESIDQLVIFETGSTAAGSEHLGFIFKAIKQKTSISIEYKSFQAGVSSLRKIEPYLLKQYENRWYVIAFEPKSSKIKTFGLDRIEKVILEDHKFQIISNFSREDFFKYSVGITTGNYKYQKVEIQFSQFSAGYIKSKPIHNSQKSISHNSNGEVFSFDIYITPELTQKIMSWGNHAKVLKPLELKLEIKTVLEKTLKEY